MNEAIELSTLKLAVKGLPDATKKPEGTTYLRAYRESLNGEDLKECREGDAAFVAATCNVRGVVKRRWLYTGVVILDEL